MHRCAATDHQQLQLQHTEGTPAGAKQLTATLVAASGEAHLQLGLPTHDGQQFGTTEL